MILFCNGFSFFFFLDGHWLLKYWHHCFEQWKWEAISCSLPKILLLSQALSVTIMLAALTLESLRYNVISGFCTFQAEGFLGFFPFFIRRESVLIKFFFPWLGYYQLSCHENLTANREDTSSHAMAWLRFNMSTQLGLQISVFICRWHSPVHVCFLVLPMLPAGLKDSIRLTARS